MNKLLILLISISSFLQAQIFVEGFINDQVWDITSTRYIVTDDLIIEGLTIGPGVVIQFRDNYEFRVIGRLIAQGTIADSIIFEAEDINPNGQWNGIRVTSSATEVLFNYCKVKDGESQGMLIEADSVEIVNCDIQNNNGYGIYVRNSYLSVQNSKIQQNNSHGVHVDRSQVDIFNTAITNNGQEGIYSTDNDDIVNLVNSIVADNNGRGVFCDNGALYVLNSIIFNNQTSIESNGTFDVTYSNIENNGVFPGAGNIEADPLFINDYELDAASLCIDTGNPLPEYYEIYFPPSKGGLRNDMGIYGGPLAVNWQEAALRVNHSVVDFGDSGVGFTKLDTIVVINPTDSGIAISSIELAGSDSSVFSLESAIFNVAADDSAIIEIGFSPTQERLFTTEINIFHSTGLIKNLLTGNGLAPLITVSRDSLNFGEVLTGRDSLRQLTFYNTGNSDLIIYSDSLQLLENPNFLLEDITEDIIVPVLDSASIDITFSPIDTGYTTAVLSVTSNDPDNSEILINLNGTGRFNENFIAAINLSQYAIDFGEVYLNEDSVVYLTIYNSGLAELVIDSDISRFSGAGGIFFSADSLQNDLLIAPGDSTILGIRFTPVNEGPTEASLHLASNDPNNNETEVTLSGSGAFSDEFFPRFGISPSAINFGEVYLNQDSILSLTVYNSGLANLILYPDSLNFTGSGASYFAIDSIITEAVIASGDSLIINVRFSPKTAGLQEATLNIYHNDAQNSPNQVLIFGTGLIPPTSLFSVSKSEIDFGEVYINEESSQSLTVFNNGLADLILYSDSLNLSGSGKSFFRFDSLLADVLIASGDSSVLAVKFSPTIDGLQEATFNIYHNDKQNNPQPVALSGTGVSVTITLNDVVTSSEFFSGESAIIAFDLQSDVTIDSCLIFLRKGGQANYIKRTMINQSANTWQLEVDANFITERGLEYFLEVYFSQMELKFPDNGSENPQTVEINIPVLEFPLQTKENVYQHISVPAVTNQQNLSDILNDDLGSYNNRKYRVFDYSAEAGYVELEDLKQPLPPGKALWVITKNPKSIDVENSKSVPTNENFEISLVEGWNMIANPFSFPVLWMDVNPGNTLRFYDGRGWLFSSVLEPYKGYLLWVDNDTVFSIPPKEYHIQAKTTNQTSDDAWYFQVSAAGKTYSDKYNYAGVKANSSKQIDKHDQYEPPPIGKYVSTYFEIEGNTQRFSSDFQQSGLEGYKFAFTIESNSLGPVAIEVIPFNLPNDFDWVVVSSDLQLNYGKTNIITNGNQRQFELHVGNPEFISDAIKKMKSLPSGISIGQNFPNPFNPITTINFQLDKPSRVQMDIYNILGQKIKTLVNNRIFDEGYHSAKWNGMNDKSEKVASGIYFLRFRAGNHSKTLKMILKN